MENQEMMNNVVDTVEETVDTTALISNANEVVKTSNGILKKIGIIGGAIVGGVGIIYGGYQAVKHWVKPAIENHKEKKATKKAEKQAAKKQAAEQPAQEIDPRDIDTTLE